MPETENTYDYSHLFDPEFNDWLTDEQRIEAAAIRYNQTDRPPKTYGTDQPPTKKQIANAAIYGFDLPKQDKYFPNQAAKRDREE